MFMSIKTEQTFLFIFLTYTNMSSRLSFTEKNSFAKENIYVKVIFTRKENR